MSKIIQSLLIITVAMFFSLVAVGNVQAYAVNWEFVHHVLEMESTFRHPALMSRAITDTHLQVMAFWLIVIWEAMVAILCWVAGLGMLLSLVKRFNHFDLYKKLATLGVFCGVWLYLFGFLTIGGEWFVMWQSVKWNAQSTAAQFTIILMSILIYLKIDTE